MAQRGLNKAQIIGNLGQDPEVRHTQNGTAVATLSIATSETWKDKQSGEQREKTEWHRVVLWDKLAEIAGEYLKKGSKVYVEGKLETRKWQDQSGADKYTTEIVVKGFDGQLQMLDSRGDGNNQGGYQSQQQSQQNQQPVSGTNVQQPNPQGQSQDDDPIPF